MRKNFFYTFLFITGLVGSLAYADIPAPPPGPPPYDPSESGCQSAKAGSNCKNSDGETGLCTADASDKLSCVIPTQTNLVSSGCSSLGSASTAFVSLFSLSLGLALLIRSRRREK